MLTLITRVAFVGLLVALPMTVVAQVAQVEAPTSGNGDSRLAYCCNQLISGDARFVAFGSDATNLVPGDTNSNGDIFVRDRTNGITTRVSVSSAGVQSNQSSFVSSLSRNGRYVVFYSNASNLVPGDERPD